MKKLVLFSTLLLLVVGLYSCKEDNFQFGKPSCSTFLIPEEDGYVGMCCDIPNGGAADSLVFCTVENKNQTQLEYFPDFSLEYYINGTWVCIYYGMPMWYGYDAPIYYNPVIVEPGETDVRVIASKAYLLSLIRTANNSRQGRYRIGINFYINGFVDEYDYYYYGDILYSEFDVFILGKD